MFDTFEIPDFDTFTRKNSSLSIDTNRIIIEVLWWIENAMKECNSGRYLSKQINMWGKKAFVIRYRDKNNIYRPVSYMSYDELSESHIHISEIQGTKERKVSYRFYTAFDVFSFFTKLIEQNFTNQGKKVTIDNVPDGVECIADKSNVPDKYIRFQRDLGILNSRIKKTS
jgi:hypothetical protein